jgi:GNAT superfamily N-acetyltransferase
LSAFSLAPVSGPLAEAFASLTFAGLLPLLRRAGLDPGVVAVGADAGGEPVGLALAQVTRDGEAELRSIAVDPHHRSRGVGTRLVEALEAELLATGCRRLGAVYPDDTPEGQRVGRLLRRRGFQEPTPLRLLCRISIPRLATAPWSLTSYPEGYEVFPWGELTGEERADVASGRERLGYPEPLNPFRREELVDPEVSVGLRVGGRVVGWCIGLHHRPDTRWVDSLFRAEVARQGGGAAPLLGRFVHRMNHAGVPFAEWEVDRRNQVMLRFSEQRLEPWGATLRSTSRALKHLGSEPRTSHGQEP